EDFGEAMEKITLGPARNILLNPADRERTAYHEAGHALVALLVPGSDPVHRVSIIPRGMALGATYTLPVDDRTSYAEDYLRARITSALGGRAAENRDKLDALARALLEAESLNEKEIRELIGLSEPHGEEDAPSRSQAARR